MVSFRIFALGTLAAAVLSTSLAEAQNLKLDNRYIIKLKGEADINKVDQFFKSKLDRYNRGRSGGNSIRNELRTKFNLNSFKAYAGTLSKDMVAELRSHSDVDFIEAEQEYSLSESQLNPPSWGLSRISQRTLNLTAPYTYPSSAGEGVDVYVIDTGIYAAHEDFEGRASLPVSFIEGEAVEDLNGHGTHVAGTVGGKLFGVAKKVKLIGVKVLSGSGTGSTAGVISGINWVAEQAKSSGRKSIANVSLGGGKSEAIVAAVEAAVKAGVTFIVAAGNESQDACNVSPANAPSAFAVGSTDPDDSRRFNSNWGACVKLSAPGTDINSAHIGGVKVSKKLSGTSMASPHVAGVAALFLAEGLVSSPQQVYDALISSATKDILTDLKGATPNLLLYSNKV
ncbi:hypothetical protein K7432_016476 [Basidiobolus ranarum]|uniref:Uncharacterized protein n=1 Tax=Basidiobolus ranarum TaxID=34480 RepID=A0ABR2WEP0_9FUNG